MPKFNVGDSIMVMEFSEEMRCVNDYGGNAEYGEVRRVLHVKNNGSVILEGDIAEGAPCWIRPYMLEIACMNPNHITVSSLDYTASTTLTNEDKRIIKEYLYENS